MSALVLIYCMHFCLYLICLFHHNLLLQLVFIQPSRYLERRDQEMHTRAQTIIKECYEKNKMGDPNYRSLSTIICARLHATVGEVHWKKAQTYLDLVIREKQKQTMKHDIGHGGGSTRSTTNAIPRPPVHLTMTPSPKVTINSPSNENNEGTIGPQPATTITNTFTAFSAAATFNSDEEEATAARRRSKWPLAGITEPGMNDCLFGRGGLRFHHPGNIRYRKLVEERKEKYRSSNKSDKAVVAMEIISEWQSLDPPGRFLKQDEVTMLWYHAGDAEALAKTLQTLRRNTPLTQCEVGGVCQAAEVEGRDYNNDLGVDQTARFQLGMSSHPASRYYVRRSQFARYHNFEGTIPSQLSIW